MRYIDREKKVITIFCIIVDSGYLKFVQTREMFGLTNVQSGKNE